MITDVLQDLRYGARMLLKNPGFTVVIIAKPRDRERNALGRHCRMIVERLAPTATRTASSWRCEDESLWR